MSYRLTYFPFGGRAEPVRIAFFLVDVAFEDRHIPPQEFPQLKASGELPLGSMPTLEIDGTTFTQSTAMLRYVASLKPEAKLYPTDPLQRLVVDSVMDTLNDTLGNALTPSVIESDPDKKKALRAEFVANSIPKCLGYVESMLGQFDGPLLTGDTLTIADIMLGQSAQWWVSGKLDGLTAELMAPYPKITKFAADYAAHPRIVAYQATKA